MKSFFTVTSFVLAAAVLISCAATDQQPLTAQAVFDRHIAASFGPDGLEGHNSTLVKGTVHIESIGVEAPVTIMQMAPDSRLVLVEVMGMTGNEGCHKGECWSQPPGQGVQQLSGDALAFQQQSADFHQYAHLDQYYASMEILPDSQDADTVGVRLVRDNGDEDLFYFSKQTGLMTASKIQAYTPAGKVPVDTTFSEYRQFAGAKIATLIEQSTPVISTTVRADEVVCNTLSDADFKRPL